MTKRRRANGEGGLFKLSDGRWAAYLSMPSTEEGKQRKIWRYGKTQKEVVTKLEMLKDLYGKAPRAHEADVPFKDYARAWLAYQRPHVSDRTMTIYSGELKNHVLPHLGNIPLNRIVPHHVRGMQHVVLEDSGPTAARHARGRARTILQQAFEDGLIPRNPAQVVKPVKAPPRSFDVWGEAEVDTFTKVSEGHSLYPMFYLGLMTGLRPGELLALTWANVLADEVLVTQGVTQPKGGHKIGKPKNPNAERAVPLPSDARELLMTRAWEYSEQRHRMTLRQGSDKLVFPNEVGNVMAPWNLHKRVWIPLLEDAGMEHVRPYVLRHTFASMNVAAGVDAVTLARWMGHSDSGFTLRTYAHFFERRVKVKPKTLNELLGRT